jgi:uncharacterized protein (TIGR00255 family)
METKGQKIIKSMTGYGRAEIYEGERKFTVEIKAVNHRYLDFNIKMPKKLSFFESGIRNELKKYIQRGKIDVFIAYEDLAETNVCVKYNKDLAAEYLRHLEQIGTDFGLDNDIRVSSLSRYPEVLIMEEQTVDETELWNHLCKTLNNAAEQFVESRIREGEILCGDLLKKLDGMKANVEYIAERAPHIVAEYHLKLTEKIKILLEDAKVDEARLLTEVAIFADRTCLDEELVRLRSHIEATAIALQEGGGIGRKLDFIAQEMNREANTITSKANDLDVTSYAIELKTEIEKIREQIQNIE